MDGNGSRVLRILVGALVFGALMTLRENAASAWVRVALAALAGAALGVTLVGARSRG